MGLMGFKHKKPSTLNCTQEQKASVDPGAQMYYGPKET